MRAGEKDAGCQRVGKAGGKLAGRLSWSHGRAPAGEVIMKFLTLRNAIWKV